MRLGMQEILKARPVALALVAVVSFAWGDGWTTDIMTRFGWVVPCSDCCLRFGIVFVKAWIAEERCYSRMADAVDGGQLGGKN